MNILTAIVILVPSVLSSIISAIYAYIAYKKAKEPPKDEIWETTTKILCANPNSIMGGDEFANVYEELKIFKENGCSLEGIQTLSFEVNEKRRKGLQKSEKDSET